MARSRMVLSDDQKIQIWRNSGILRRWYNKTWEQFDNDPAAYEIVRKYSDNIHEYIEDGIGLFLHGSNGVGKTHLLMQTLKDAAVNRLTVQVVTLGTLVSRYTQGWYDKEMFLEFENLYKRPAILAIEEIGKEYKSGDNDLGRTVLDTIVRYRSQDMRPILFATNLSPEQIKKVYTIDIASMLSENSIIVEVTGVDKRTVNKPTV